CQQKYDTLFFSITGAYRPLQCQQRCTLHPPRHHDNSAGVLTIWLLGTLSPAPLYHKATITLLIFYVLIVPFTKPARPKEGGDSRYHLPRQGDG
ncbi:hypothetical protein C0991_008338, partial [Blastosporella zonata]